jgi:hypothetical protein
VPTVLVFGGVRLEAARETEPDDLVRGDGVLAGAGRYECGPEEPDHDESPAGAGRYECLPGWSGHDKMPSDSMPDS